MANGGSVGLRSDGLTMLIVVRFVVIVQIMRMFGLI